jgi:hypothetical protein
MAELNDSHPTLDNSQDNFFGDNSVRATEPRKAESINLRTDLPGGQDNEDNSTRQELDTQPDSTHNNNGSHLELFPASQTNEHLNAPPETPPAEQPLHSDTESNSPKVKFVDQNSTQGGSVPTSHPIDTTASPAPSHAKVSHSRGRKTQVRSFILL